MRILRVSTATRSCSRAFPSWLPGNVANSQPKTTHSDAKPLRSNGSRRCRGPLHGLTPFPAAGGHLAFLIRHLAFLIRHLAFLIRHSACPRSVLGPIVRTLTTFSLRPDFVRVLTTFRPLRGRARHLPFWHSDLRQFCPLKNPSKTEQKRNKTEENGHQNRKNRSQTSAFCLAYLNIGSQKPPSRPRNGVQSQKKRAFGGFGQVRIDVSVMQPDACKPTARPVRIAALARRRRIAGGKRRRGQVTGP